MTGFANMFKTNSPGLSKTLAGSLCPRSTATGREGSQQALREDRRWETVRSPEQIAGSLCIDFPNDVSMRISHEAIYQALYVHSLGGPTRQLITTSARGGCCGSRVPEHTTDLGAMSPPT
jgi:hypothetical protein